MASSTASTSKETLDIQLEFGGGTELLLRPPRSKKQSISIPARVPLDTADGGAASSSSSLKPPAPVVTAPESSGTAANAGGNEEAQGRPADMRFLVQWILRNLIVEREELFVDADGEGIRPGILVLINDADWELEGELEYELQDKDEICFISTLHGG